MRRRLLTLILALILPAFAPAADDSAAFLDSLAGRELQLLPPFNPSPVVYSPQARPEVWLLRGGSDLLRLTGPARVTLARVRWERRAGRVVLELEHRRIGRGELALCWPPGTQPSAAELRELLRLALVGEGLATPPLVVGDRSSRRLHYLGANHLPADSLRESFSTEQEALAADYTERCPLCFRRLSPDPDYELELELGRQVANQAGGAFPGGGDGSGAAGRGRLERAGRRVLERWPWPLRGYEYFFGVVPSRELQAWAIPGGRLVATSGLLQALEREEELEAVLAHEIAHIERRHGLRDYRRMLQTQRFAALAGLAAGLAAAGAVPDRASEEMALLGLEAMALFAARLVASGHSLESEQEADATAAAYLAHHGLDLGLYRAVLRKLQYGGQLQGMTRERSGPFPTHPAADFRVECAERGRYRRFEPVQVFGGYDREGRLVAELRLEGEYATAATERREPEEGPVSLTSQPEIGSGRSRLERRVNRHYLFASLRATEELGPGCRVGELRLMTAAGRIALEDRGESLLPPLGETSLTFQRESDRLIEGEVLGVALGLDHVKEWRRIGTD